MKKTWTHEDYHITIEKEIQGHIVQERSTQAGVEYRIFVRGVTEYWHEGHWMTTLWVPSECVEKGKPWKSDMADSDSKKTT
jgi:hypothetical protein